MTVPDCDIDWSQEFALISPLNDRSQLALKNRFNRRHQVDGTRYGLRHPSSPTKRRTAIKLDFAMLLGRRCVSFGTSRANSITLPKGQGISNAHFHIHFHPQTNALLLTASSNSKVYIHNVSGTNATRGESIACGSTVTLSANTRVSLGARRQFEFDIHPTPVAPSQQATFEKLYSSWRKSIPEQSLQKIRRLSAQQPRASCRRRRNQPAASTITPDGQAGTDIRSCAVQ